VFSPTIFISSIKNTLNLMSPFFSKAMPVVLGNGSVPLFLLPIVVYKNNDTLSASVPSGLDGQGKH
jgi:hypothetical protein